MIHEFSVSDDTGTVCTLQIDNGSGYSVIDSTCYGSEANRTINITSYLPTAEALNGLRFKMNYQADSLNDYLYFDYVGIEYNASTPPGYDIWGMNVSNGAIIRRDKHVKAYAHWNYSDGITNALISHSGDGSER